eukprot:CAMPEP_0184011402 /NCGR_PEP_ID=MMETSP0954-20121128/3808_1 /TAXON_ID=627963 /ORGANISM="Aplanochytrium sp, Strain PBS07" /LENGTH=307 /DNA_ID=CAMNT_0026291217 /DNA_START=74 /DNA_END=997 /DNA_ORIENTATION=+
MALDFQAMLREATKNAKKSKSRVNNLDNRNSVLRLSPKTLEFEKNAVVLQSNTLGRIANEAFYVSDFLTKGESNCLEKAISSGVWTKLTNRKLQNYGGVPHASGTIHEPLPDFLAEVSNVLQSCGVFDQLPNHALVNEYDPGIGLDFHKDGQYYQDTAAILSLSSPCLIHFAEEATTKVVATLLLEPGSLFFFKGRAFTHLKHGICHTKEEDLSKYSIANQHLLNKDFLSKPPVDNSWKYDESTQILSRGRRISVTMRCLTSVSYSMESSDEVLPPHLQEERERRYAWWKAAISDVPLMEKIEIGEN